MTTIDIDETIRNAILAALDERAVRLDLEVATAQKAVDYWRRNTTSHVLTEDAQRALVWNIAALHETNMARLLVSEAEPTQTLAESVAWVEADKWTDEQKAAAGYHDWSAR